MNEAKLLEIATWVAEAGLNQRSGVDLLNGFCERVKAAGVPLSRVHVFIDTLHPVHEGQMFRWGHDQNETAMSEYGRVSVPTGPDGTFSEQQQRNINAWRNSPFYRMLEDGSSLVRFRLTIEDDKTLGVLDEMRQRGMTDYMAMITRISPEGTVGEMDNVYSSWATRNPEGFSDSDIAALQRLSPFLAHAIKTISLGNMTGTLMQTYLGRDAGRRVLSGRIVRGIADRIDAAIWFSDLRGFTRITDTAPEQVIPLLDDYAEVIVSAIHNHGGDVLKLIGDGILAIFQADDRATACDAALAAALAAQRGIAATNERRVAGGVPVTDMYLGLHVGEVFYGNIGSTERLDFTVIGPAVNETSRIAAMCRSAEQPLLVSSTFADVGDNRKRLVSVGRYALRGLGRPQELFTIDTTLNS
jgi:adenylate cyclase